MKTDDITIYRDVPVKITHKIWHVHKIGGKCHRDFTSDYGDLPEARYNPDSGMWERVVNNRGYGYAARNRLKYRNKKK